LVARFLVARFLVARFLAVRFAGARFLVARFLVARFAGARFFVARRLVARFLTARFTAARRLVARFLTARFTVARFFVALFLTVRLAAVARFLAVRLAGTRFLVVRFAADLRAAVFLAGLLRVDLLAAAFFTAIDTPSLGFNADLNVEPVANRTAFDAGIGTTAPVRGFRPRRGPRALGMNDPNPTTVTFRPDWTSVMIVSNTPSTTSETVRRDESVASLTARTSCDLFKITSSVIRHHIPAKWLFLPRSSIPACHALVILLHVGANSYDDAWRARTFHSTRAHSSRQRILYLQRFFVYAST
jgi:hypothetical protein